MIDTVRGVLRVRKWPKKRGTPKSTLQLFWIDWFRQANRLAKYVDAASAIRAIELSRHSGFYPRDILLKAMRGRLYTWVDETGWKWYSVAAIGDISESLDVLAQQIGSVLVRATDRWRAPPPGAPGDVLTYQGPDDPPSWEVGGGGGLAFQGALVKMTADKSVATSTWTAVPFAAEEYDTDDLHDNVTLNTRFTVPVGWTHVGLNGSISWTNVSTNHRWLTFRKNGAEFHGSSMHRVRAAGTSNDSIQSPAIPVTGGDYFELVVNQNAGSTIKVIAGIRTNFAMQRVA